MEKKVVAVSGAMMNRGIAEFGLKGLPENLADHFVMHPWQAMQILNFALAEAGLTDIVMADQPIVPGEPGWNMCGIKVVEDPHFPMDYIELRDKDENVLVEFRNVGSLNEHGREHQR